MNLRCQELLRSQCFVDGTWIDGAQGHRLHVINPASSDRPRRRRRNRFMVLPSGLMVKGDGAVAGAAAAGVMTRPA